MSEGVLILPNTEAARRAIQAARSIDEVKEILDKAVAVKVYAQQRGMQQEIIDGATEIIIRAERKAGELLLQIERTKGGRGKKSSPGDGSFTSTIREAKVSEATANRWQGLAKVPEKAVEEAIAKAKKGGGSVTRKAVREAVHEHVPAAPRDLPPAPPQDVKLLVADATDHWPQEAGMFDLCVTSPPYGLAKSYAGYSDPAVGWGQFMLDWTAKARSCAGARARLAVNVPLDTTKGGFRPTYAETVSAAVRSGWIYRFSIVWNEGNVSGSTGRGSVDSCKAPHCIAPVEMVAVFSAEKEWGCEMLDRVSDLGHEEWLAWTNGLWTFPGESRPWEGHPAPFPVELPHRLIKLLCPRCALVVDPFLGSGTSALAAHRLGRRFVGFDASQEYVESSMRRVAPSPGMR